MLRHIRRYSSHIRVSEEIRNAVNSNIPVVALESTIITHGLPYPENIEMASSVENLIRSEGAVPATIAFVKGVPTVGVSKEDLLLLGNDKNNVKISRRDIPSVMSRKLTGGTTIASTMMLANFAGIDVFSTGGLGGVSRPSSLMDVSADLDELSKTPVAVVCSGPKSILDIGKTLEYLETKGVPVSTFIDEYTKSQIPDSIKARMNQLQQSTAAKDLNELNRIWESLKINVPGFYVRDSGFTSPFVWENPMMAADMIHNGKYNLNLENGYVFCAPAPIEVAMDKSNIDTIIEQAQELAERNNISGKNLTPFMLKTLYEKTNGKSAEVNVAFVKNNTILGSKIACDLAKLKGGGKSYFQPIHDTKEKPVETFSSSYTDTEAAPSIVVGSVALDTTCKISNTIKFNDSNPGKITTTSVGGVGFNVSLAAKLSNKSNPVVLITAINKNDVAGNVILSKFQNSNMSIDGIINVSSDSTAQYISMHDKDGKLELACADMDIIENLPQDLVIKMIEERNAKHILIDMNISVELINAIVGRFPDSKILIEPTSGVKCAKMGMIKLPVFPQTPIELITPTVQELSTIYESAKRNGKFEDLEGWFNVLDSLGIRPEFRERLVHASHKFPIIKKYIEKGVFQQAFQLLPYFPIQFIKDGPCGVLVVQIITNSDSTGKMLSKYDLNFNDGRETSSSFTISSDLGRHNLSVLIQHFPVYDLVPKGDIKNVTGAGDSFIGYVLANLQDGDLYDVASLPVNSARENLIMGGQRAAAASLVVDEAVNEEHLARM